MNQKRVAVLGGGNIGAAVAADLAADSAVSVTVMDKLPDVLCSLRERGASVKEVDVTEPDALRDAIAPFDLVMGALPSKLGLGALGVVIDEGKPYCDMSFMPEDATALSPKARARGVTAVFDCGLAPGLSHMMAGYAASALDPCERIDIHVGGLPAERFWPYEYKAGFSPLDIIEEYTRPARCVERGEIVVRDALSEPELIDFPGVGTLEAFLVDGLRSLIRSLHVPNMRQKTLRYPGHIALMRALRETGFFSKEAISAGGVSVRPLDVTAALLFPRWTFAPGEADFTVLRVSARGRRKGVPTTLTWDLLDRYDPATNLRSVARATAFVATITARLMLEGKLQLGPGVHPPEAIGKEPGMLQTILAELGRKGVRATVKMEPAA